MPGPAVGLWLFEPPMCEDVLTVVAPWLARFCDPVETTGGDLVFWVRDGTAVGLPGFDLAGVGGFSLSEDEEIPAQDEDYSAFAQPPVRGLVLGAGCSGPVNHLLLGHLTLALAKRLGALIDFDGLLGRGLSHDAAGDDASANRSRAPVASLPGKLVKVAYDTDTPERAFRHVGDVQFLEAWLQHPDFHLVK
ncbi:DUF6368 family protein [Streptomyces sp. 8N114]|uniref:DUF6368 family protein n=1 Tax=Streptomyces sp. 8N114 TaxID=3457419 RepID=UPI003FD3C1C6